MPPGTQKISPKKTIDYVIDQYAIVIALKEKRAPRQQIEKFENLIIEFLTKQIPECTETELDTILTNQTACRCVVEYLSEQQLDRLLSIPMAKQRLSTQETLRTLNTKPKQLRFNYCGNNTKSFNATNITNYVAFYLGMRIASDRSFAPLKPTFYNATSNSLFPLTEKELRIAARLRSIIDNYLPKPSEFEAATTSKEKTRLKQKITVFGNMVYGFFTKFLTRHSPRSLVFLAHHDPVILKIMEIKILEPLFSAIIPYIHQTTKDPDYRFREPTYQTPVEFIRGYYTFEEAGQTCYDDREKSNLYLVEGVKLNHIYSICNAIEKEFKTFHDANETIKRLQQFEIKSPKDIEKLVKLQIAIIRHAKNQQNLNNRTKEILQYLKDMELKLTRVLKNVPRIIEKYETSANRATSAMFTLANRVIIKYGPLGFLIRSLFCLEMGRRTIIHKGDKELGNKFGHLAFIDAVNALRLSDKPDLTHNAFRHMGCFGFLRNFPVDRSAIFNPDKEWNPVDYFAYMAEINASQITTEERSLMLR